MKKLILISIIALTGCAKTNQQKAEKLVGLYLDSSLNDPKSYQSVKFRKLDTLNASALSEPKYLALETKYDSLIDESNKITRMIPYMFSIPKLMFYKKESNRLYLEERANLKGQGDFLKTYKVKQIGWAIYHTYRAKNGVGALTIGTTVFYFNKALTKIDSVSEVKK